MQKDEEFKIRINYLVVWRQLKAVLEKEERKGKKRKNINGKDKKVYIFTKNYSKTWENNHENICRV